MISYPRRTVKTEVVLEGLGLHSGVPVRVQIHPGEKGIAFRLNGDRVLARPENVTETTRCTTLGSISTIEHLMSAFAGLEITDAEVEVDAPELPGLDGSALPYVEGLLKVGLVEIGTIEIPEIYGRVFLQDDQVKIAVSKGAGHWRFVYAINDRWPGTQSFESLKTQEEFAAEVAPARTFVLAEEIPMIIQLGLGKGLDENTALILGIEGYKNKSRFVDEPARHKLLDLIGDLYLSGVPIRHINVVAERSGHRTNVKAAALLAQAVGNLTA
jgi:UDP-3-O-[3-hydroxymyristoyl] N-acetylglucosamine deacetylase